MTFISCKIFSQTFLLLWTFNITEVLCWNSTEHGLYDEFLQEAVGGGYSENPGAILTVNEPGVNYAFDLAGRVLNNEIMNLNISDIYEKFDGGYIGVSNLVIISYNPPKFVRQFYPPDRLMWGINGAGVKVQGNWRGSKKVLLSLSGQGSFKAQARKLDVSVEVVVTNTSDGRPLLINATCKSDLGAIDLFIKGGLSGWLLNVFQKFIINSVQPILQNKICEIARDFVKQDINRELSTFPVKVGVVQNVNLYLALFNTPQFTLNSTVVTSHSGRVQSAASNSTPFEPRNLNMISSSPVADKMVSLRVSDYVANALLHHIYLSDFFNVEIDPGQFGRVSCSILKGQICMGSIFDELSNLYPATSTVRIKMKALSSPVAFFVENRTIFHGLGEITLKILDQEKAQFNDTSEDELSYLKIEINITAEIKEAYIANSTLYSRLNLTGFNLALLDEEEKIPADLWRAFSAFIRPLLRNILNNMFQRGWPLKLIDGVTFHDGRVEFFNRTMLIEADLDYYHDMKPGYVSPSRAHRCFGGCVHYFAFLCAIFIFLQSAAN